MNANQNKTIYDLLHRRSYRTFTPDALKQEELQTILDCGVFAPSAMNQQPWHFTVVRDKQLMDDMVAAMADIMKQSGDARSIERASSPDFHSFHHAPCVILVSGAESAIARASDCGGATTCMAVAAQALGIGSVIVASILPIFQGKRAGEFMERLQVPAGYIPTLTLALGYPGCAEPDAPARKESVITYID